MMADDLVAIAAEDEDRLRACAECGPELRTAAHQLAGSITELTGCTAEQRFELRQLATFMLRTGDRLAPAAAVHDPDENVVYLDDAA